MWLKIIVQSEMMTKERLESLLDECDQLCRIIGSSIQTASRGSKQ
ncbi:MAG TPA: hypothetical protein VFI27_23050 [candidate division Zixibacteria bacterium]|nr:hypothetical protein [candidate division Zixibacteria bacterium]